ncbi:MAG: type II secretion system minor pseudopilin GspH [Pseudomonadota bacterium]
MRVGRYRSLEAKHQRGMTLVELIVTLVIIGIAIAFVLPQVSWIDEDTEIEAQANALATVIELARDEAALQGRNFGLRFYPTGYAIVELEPDTGAWITIEDDELLVDGEFDEKIVPLLVIEERTIELELPEFDSDEDDEPETDIYGQPIPVTGEIPHLVILASGEVTPFMLELDEVGSDAFIRVNGDFLGNLEFTTERIP